jgi:hypothetical protein
MMSDGDFATVTERYLEVQVTQSAAALEAN